MMTKRFVISSMAAMALGVTVSGQAFAYNCPALVKECQATADIVSQQAGSDKAAIEKARRGCDEAMKLHQDGKHRESMIKAGEAIAAISRALK